MRQHFKVAHRHALSDKEIPTQDFQKGKQQRLEYAEVYSHEDHDLVEEDESLEIQLNAELTATTWVILTKMILVIVNQWWKIIWMTKI